MSLAFDLDDTLLDSKKRIGRHTLQVLSRWLGCGRHVFLATSRPFRAVRRFVERDLLERCHIITLNGAIRQFGFGSPHGHAKLGQIAKAIVEDQAILTSTRLMVEIQGEAFASNFTYTEEQLASIHSATPDMVIPLGKVDYTSVSKVAIDGNGVSLLHHVAWIERMGGRAIPALDGTFLNVVDPTVDKAEAIRGLFQELGLSLENLMAFGDDIPDLGMLRLAGVSVAMGNARSEVKQVAHHVIEDCNGDAIGKFIEREYPYFE